MEILQWILLFDGLVFFCVRCLHDNGFGPGGGRGWSLLFYYRGLVGW